MERTSRWHLTDGKWVNSNPEASKGIEDDARSAKMISRWYDDSIIVDSIVVWEQLHQDSISLDFNCCCWCEAMCIYFHFDWISLILLLSSPDLCRDNGLMCPMHCDPVNELVGSLWFENSDCWLARFSEIADVFAHMNVVRNAYETYEMMLWYSSCSKCWKVDVWKQGSMRFLSLVCGQYAAHKSTKWA